MKYLSVCSGIEAATMAWRPLGWEPVAFSEIEPFPSAVLKHHYPEIPNIGDMTKIKGADYAGAVDLITGGTPCQSFSVAGLRGGLDDTRGNLALVFMRLVDQIRPSWVVWENVPGVLSSNRGRDFGSILGALAECGYGFAYRVLDAQYFGVPQRRRRVFLVGSLRGWQSAAAVLFERESLQRDTPPSRSAGQEVAAPITASFAKHHGRTAGNNGGVNNMVITKRTREVALSHWDGDYPHPTLTQVGGGGIGASNQEIFSQHGAYLVPVGIGGSEIGYALRSNPSRSGDKGDGGVNTTMVVDFGRQADRIYMNADTSATIQSQGGGGGAKTGLYLLPETTVGGRVRRLTPIECERLMGFPDNYTQIPWKGKPAADCPDGPRYKACGNSQAVPVMAWLGRRIEKVEEGAKAHA